MKKLLLIAAGFIFALAACSKNDYQSQQSDLDETAASMISANSGPNFDDISDHIDSLINSFRPSGIPDPLRAGFITLDYPVEGGISGRLLLDNGNPQIVGTFGFNPGTTHTIGFTPSPDNMLMGEYYYEVESWYVWDVFNGVKTFLGFDYADQESFTYTIHTNEWKVFKPKLRKLPKSKCQLNIVSGDQAKGTVTGGGQYCTGVSIPVTVTPKAGYVFDRWEITGDQTGGNMPTIFPGSNDNEFYVVLNTHLHEYTLKAHFLPSDKATVNVVSADTNKGTVSGSGLYSFNQAFTITATPKAGYKFSHWEKNGVKIDGAGAAYTSSAPDNSIFTFTAFFIPLPAVDTVNLHVNFLVGNQTFVSASRIQYYDGYKTVNADIPASGEISYDFTVQKGIDINITLVIHDKGTGQEHIYCLYWGPDGSVHDYSTEAGPLTSDIETFRIYQDSQITIRAELEDFRENV